MGKSAPIGVIGLLAKPSGDLADYVVTGTLTAVGPGIPYQVFGPFNVALWASINTALTTTNGSSAASVVSGTGLAAGVSVNSVNVPLGTTWATFAGTSGTLAFPTVTLAGFARAGTSKIGGLGTVYQVANLVGAAVTGPNIPASTTVLSVSGDDAILSNAPTASSPTTTKQFFSFALTNQAVTTGTDTAAVFTGAAIVWSGTVNIERSFDGGATWIVANAGGGGTLAQYTAGPANLAFGEPEKGVLYRPNCIAYVSGTINYRFSTSGSAAMSLGLNQLS